MKILLLNWRDIKNPLSGGAEILTYEIATRLVKKGHDVTWFSSQFPGGKPEEIIDGIKFIRQGSPDLRGWQNSTHFKAYKFYKNHMQGKIDVVIDEIHGMPFFTPLYIKEKKVVLICEVARDIWDKMFSFPWNIIGKLLERLYFVFYRNIQFLTISSSTKEDLIAYGVNKDHVTVLPMGINKVHVQNIKKEIHPTIIFVGRINKMKGVLDGLDAFSQIVSSNPSAKFWIVGDGDPEYIRMLKNFIKEKKLIKSVYWFGFVSQRKKFELMSKAWGIVVPSIREGFGLIVPEAGSVETPAIVYDVAGLRDIVKDNINGIKVPRESISGLAHAMQTFINDKKRYGIMKSLAKKEANSYNWDNTTEEAIKVLTQ